MKLLFTEGAEEIKALLGFVDADFDNDKIKSQLYTATRELKKLIGSEAYEYFHALYTKPTGEEEGSITEEEEYILYNARYPIALDAVRNYAPLGDLNFTKNGRKMRNDDNQTAAWEWMVNRSDESLEKHFYKSIDTLLEVLDDINPIFKPADGETPPVKWKNTEAYLKTHRLFVRSTSDFDNYFPISSRLLLLKLQPGLSQCERLDIVPRIGKDKNKELKAALLEPSSEVDADLLELIKEACVYYALAWGVRRLRVSLLPEGVLQRYSGERVNSKNTKVPEKWKPN
jgi:hypothetical protein